MIPSLTRSDHVGFVVPDLDEAVRFFVDVLGASLVFKLGPWGAAHGQDGAWMYDQMRLHPDSILRVALLRVTSNLGLELYEIEAPDQRREHVRAYDIGAPHLSFRVNDFDAAYEYLQRVEGVTLHGVPQAPEDGELAGMRWLHFETPWGLVLEIDEWPISPYGDET